MDPFPSAHSVTVVTQRVKVAGTSLGIAYVVKTGGEGSHRTPRVVSG